MMRAALVPLAMCGAAALTSCGGETHHYEKDLVIAQCTLVERMFVLTMMKSDEDFELAVNCNAPGMLAQSYPILDTQNSAEYGLILDSSSGALPRVTVYYCPSDRGGVTEVAERIKKLNNIASKTGISFAMGPFMRNCADRVAQMPGAISGQSSKDFDRDLN